MQITANVMTPRFAGADSTSGHKRELHRERMLQIQGSECRNGDASESVGDGGPENGPKRVYGERK